MDVGAMGETCLFTEARGGGGKAFATKLKMTNCSKTRWINLPNQ